MIRRIALCLLVVGGISVAGTGCGESQQGSIPAREITFPVLWAGTDAKGVPTGGIEPAGIAVETRDDSGFTVTLDDIQAKGAGPQWLASTAMAGAVATLASGANPSRVDLGYTITGPIDGPSGGAALTVGTFLGQQGRATEASLVDAARVLADVRLAIATFGPDAVAMVRASPSTRTMSEADAVAFLSGDTNFMVRAGAANKDLYEKVSRGQVGAGTAGDIVLSFNALSGTVAQTPQQQDPLLAEIVQSARALTFYVLGNTLVTGSSLGLSGFGLGSDPTTAAPARLEYAVTASAAGTDA